METEAQGKSTGCVKAGGAARKLACGAGGAAGAFVLAQRHVSRSLFFLTVSSMPSKKKVAPVLCNAGRVTGYMLFR